MNLSRIGDMAVNIAEDVIYRVEGNIIRHWKKNAQDKPEYFKLECGILDKYWKPLIQWTPLPHETEQEKAENKS